jgi:hypothetical protein
MVTYRPVIEWALRPRALEPFSRPTYSSLRAATLDVAVPRYLTGGLELLRLPELAPFLSARHAPDPQPMARGGGEVPDLPRGAAMVPRPVMSHEDFWRHGMKSLKISHA